MKTIIIAVFIIFNVSLFAQQNPLNLTKPLQLDDKKQVLVVLQMLMQIYSDAFIYYDKINKGQYEILEENGDYYIYVFGEQKDVIDKIRLKRVKDQNGIKSMMVEKNVLDKLVDKSKFITREKRMNNRNGSDMVIVNTNGILIDREILNFDPNNNYGKILSRDFCRRYLKYKGTGEASPLFDYCVDGIIVPYSSGIGAKLLMVDKGWGTIKYVEKDSIIKGINTYGQYGRDKNQMSYPTGIVAGRSYTSGTDVIFPVYISDQNNHRLIRTNFVINSSGQSHFDESSYKVLDSTLGGITDVCYFTSQTGADKIWVSGTHGVIPTLTSFDTSGNVVQRVIGYKNPNGGEDLLFGTNTDIRLTSYSDGFYSLVFTDNMRNLVVPCQLDSNGNASLNSLGSHNFDIIAETLLEMPSGYYVNSVKYQKTSPQTLQWVYLWVTTGLSSVFGDNGSMVHLYKVNGYSHWQYMGSSSKPKNSDYTFSQLLNTVVAGGYYDLFTMESWALQTYGLRRYVPFVDITNDGVSNYCAADSADDLQWHATFTNDCWAKISAERKNGTSWQSVDIKSIDYTNYSPGTKQATIYRYAGWTQDHPVKIKLRLPIKDYIFGDSIRLHTTLYPEYLDTLVGNQFLQKDYQIYVSKTCLPKPGGCPFLYVTDTAGNYIPDNNILDKSEYSGSGDITDRYKLQLAPLISNNLIELSLLENQNDHAFINQVRLFAVDYPNNLKMGVTDVNAIVTYDSTKVTASDSVMFRSNKITKKVNYFGYDSIPTAGNKNDSMYAHFHYGSMSPKNIKENYSKKAINLKNKVTESGIENKAKGLNNIDGSDNFLQLNFAFISDLSNLTNPVASAKDTGGVVIANSIYSNIVTKSFARRERSSVVILPLFGDTNKVNNFTIKFLSDFQMKYLGIANLQYSGFTTTEMPISKGHYVTSTNDSIITSALTSIDSSYGLVNSSGLITVTFDASNLPRLGSGYKREYVFEVTGHYTAGSDAPLSLNVHQQQLPLVYKLAQNYPNPFNPTTKINFEIPKNSLVKLIIYDILGREVKKLVDNEFKQAGRYNVDFDGTNLASGIYFYRIEAGTFTDSKKMVLVK